MKIVLKLIFIFLKTKIKKIFFSLISLILCLKHQENVMEENNNKKF